MESVKVPERPNKRYQISFMLVRYNEQCFTGQQKDSCNSYLLLFYNFIILLDLYHCGFARTRLLVDRDLLSAEYDQS